MAQLKVTEDLLNAAVLGFEAQRTQIDAKISEIKLLLNGSTLATAPTETVRPHAKRSAAVRKKMRMAQQLRWRKIREAAAPPQAVAAKPKKRVMSASAKKRIPAAQKATCPAIK